jgi:head-tail adaptor
MATVASIAQKAFDAVAASITDAVYEATLSNSGQPHTGRVVFGGEKAPSGFPMSQAKGRVREAYLEGFGAIPAPGATLTVNSVVYYICGVLDVVKAGSFSVVRCIAESDMLWQSVNFERKTATPDGMGAQTYSWGNLAGSANTGGIVAVSGSERWANMRSEVVAKWLLVVPYFDGLTANDRVVIDGKAHNITFINDHERRGVWYVLDLSEGVAT